MDIVNYDKKSIVPLIVDIEWCKLSKGKGEAMLDFVELIEKQMSEKNLSVRALESIIRDRFEENARVSKSLISCYLNRTNIPTYQAAYQIAVSLDMDVEKALRVLNKDRKSHKEKIENDEFSHFLKEICS